MSHRQQQQPGGRGKRAERSAPMGRCYSARSETALLNLDSCENELQGYEDAFKEMVVACTEQPQEERLVEIKNALAIMIGKTEKLQDTGIDAVLVGKLSREEVLPSTRSSHVI